jgi:hypothetical protein
MTSTIKSKTEDFLSMIEEMIRPEDDDAQEVKIDLTKKRYTPLSVVLP